MSTSHSNPALGTSAPTRTSSEENLSDKDFLARVKSHAKVFNPDDDSDYSLEWIEPGEPEELGKLLERLNREEDEKEARRKVAGTQEGDVSEDQ